MTLSESELVRITELVGAEHVRTDEDALSQSVSSWSPLRTKRQGIGVGLPSCVVHPADTSEVAALVRWANETRTALVAVGGTSNTVSSIVASGNMPTVALDLSRLTEVSWDEESLLVTVGAGCKLQDLEEQLNRHDYTLGQYIGSAQTATIGGLIASNAVGVFSGKYGRQADLTIALEAVLPNGQILRTHTAPGANAYFNLLPLLIGTEGRFGVVTEATLVMRPVPEARAWAVFAYKTWNETVDAARLVCRSDAHPAAVRAFDVESARPLLEKAEAAPLAPGGGLLLLSFEGEEVTQTGPYQLAYAVCERAGGEPRSPVVGDAWFDGRQSPTAWAANARPGGLGDVWAFSAPWSGIKSVTDEVRRAIAPLTTRLSVQLCHAQAHGAALECTWEATAPSDEAAIELYERIIERAHNACLSADGWPVHHYGIGKAHREAWQNGLGNIGIQTLQVMKAALDPNGVFPPL